MVDGRRFEPLGYGFQTPPRDQLPPYLEGPPTPLLCGAGGITRSLNLLYGGSVTNVIATFMRLIRMVMTITKGARVFIGTSFL